jgi:hypothetical protein
MLTVSALFSQLRDDFSDGDLTSNPTWQGNVSHFKINTAGELQLSAPASGSSVLFTNLRLTDSAFWETYLRLEFEPSSANWARIYLWADTSDFAKAKAYYLQLGESGTQDAVRFYRQDGANAELIASGTSAAISSSQVELRLRVSYRAGGNWTLEADYTGGEDYLLEATFQDTKFKPTRGYFGFMCLYSATRTDKFFFDDVVAEPILPDTTAPRMVGLQVRSDRELELVFDEKLSPASASNTANYTLVETNEHPISAVLNGIDGNVVALQFGNPFRDRTTYTLAVSGVADITGNALASQTRSFTYLDIRAPEEFDLLIDEIMADPSPAIGLPEFEFVELFNRSSKTLTLRGLTLTDGSSTARLPDSLLLPGEFAIVCAESAAASLLPFGKTLPVATFPGLNNEGDNLWLADATGRVLHSIGYSDDWYANPAKAAGGWSLEMINPNTPCVGSANWTASLHLSGGTPGRANSVLKQEADSQFPDLLRAFPESPTSVVLTFSEGLKRSSVRPEFFAFSPPLRVTLAEAQAPLFTTVRLLMDEPLVSGQIYEISVGSRVSDCAGNPISLRNKTRVALSEKPAPRDLVVNEILFNPESFGYDFVEFYNRSSKVFDLATIQLASFTDGKAEILPFRKNFLVFPGEYVAITEGAGYIKSRYTAKTPDNLIENDLPTLPDDAGNFTLLWKDIFAPVTIDSLDYSAGWHYPLLDVVDGVSLERLHPDLPTQDASSWHSAAQTAGFATPTARNSQFAQAGMAAFDDFFRMEKTVFSPDNDGYDDFLLIEYANATAGYQLTAKVFDAAGRPVLDLANSELLGTESILRWDGQTAEGRKAPVGIYVLWLEIFAPSGERQVFNRSCVLAAKLE